MRKALIASGFACITVAALFTPMSASAGERPPEVVADVEAPVFCAAKAFPPAICGTDCVSGVGGVTCLPTGPTSVDVTIVQLATDGRLLPVGSQSSSSTGTFAAAIAEGRTCESEGLLTRTPVFFTVVTGTLDAFDIAGPTPIPCGA
ncbi:MAG TPA: hypothetical protein VG318_14715 [Actinomycetota bacterium]|nr:hypothetical protein [Actinomycetota bacterium]